MKLKNAPNVATLYGVTSGSRSRNKVRAPGRNIKLEIEYDGTNYSGWQIQNKTRAKSRTGQPKTIQGAIEAALNKILQEDVRLIVSGRTDAGVSALAQIANFKSKSGIKLQKLQLALNGNLPEDIIITKIEEAPLDFHSRFSAKSKLYRYSILNRGYPAVFLRNRAWFYPHPINIRLMQEEAKILLGRHDFSAFKASGSRVKSPVRNIIRLNVGRVGDLVCIDIEADGFLYNMARNIVGTLVEIGRGKLAKGSLKEIMQARDRKSAGPTAPASGLCLMKVKY